MQKDFNELKNLQDAENVLNRGDYIKDVPPDENSPFERQYQELKHIAETADKRAEQAAKEANAAKRDSTFSKAVSVATLIVSIISVIVNICPH